MRPVFVLSSSLLVIGLLAPPAAAEPEPEPALALSDFAYSQSLTPAPNRALQTALVPVEVYRGALRKSLADVRVFDPEGHEVPHAIRTLASPTARPRSSSRLPLFPLKEAAGGQSVGELAIHIERNAEGEVIDIRSAAPGGPGEVDARAAGRTVSYILDARAVKDPIVKLTVAIADAGSDYVLPIRVEASNNLEQWRTVPTAAPLARLHFQGNQIEHDALEVTPTRAKYLRLSWPDHVLPGSVSQVLAEAQPKQEQPQRISVTLRGEPVSGEPGVYVFDAGGFVPADSVRVQLPEVNTLVKAKLDSSDDANGPWNRATRGRFYRIVDDGQEVQQPAASLARRAPRFWRLEITAGQKELGASRPNLTLSFYPDQVLFVSRDSGEHTLVYGSYKASAPDFDTSDLIELTHHRSDDPLPRATAKLGPQRSVSGVAALEEPPPPPPFRTYFLWAILVLSVLLLAAFALRLLRQER